MAITYNPEAAKAELKRKGWSYRTAAPLIGRSYQWIYRVLNNVQRSRPVIEAIYKLPLRPKALRSTKGKR